MTFKQFENFINALVSFYDRENQLSAALEPFNSSWTVFEFCPEIAQCIFDYLKECFKDEGDWIGYWFFELERGTRTDLGASYKDGSPIKLDTVEDLYNFLIENQKDES